MKTHMRYRKTCKGMMTGTRGNTIVMIMIQRIYYLVLILADLYATFENKKHKTFLGSHNL